MWQKLAEMWRKLSTGGKALTIVVAALVVIILLFCFLPVMKVPYDVEESYLATETYYTPESYTTEDYYIDTETYTDIEITCDEEPCTEYIPIDYTIISVQGFNYFAFDGSPVSRIEMVVANNDTMGGEFTVEFLITIQSGLTTTISGAKEIDAGTTRTITAFYTEPLKTLDSFTYSVDAPQKLDPSYTEEEVTKDRRVVAFGEVTKDRYVPVEVTVLKTRTVTAYKRVSLLNYLINY